MTLAGITPARRPLAGRRVLELGQILAGPFAGQLLGAFGAEVIKVEPPGAGDPIRTWRGMDGDTSLWWRSLARNKKCITLDLRRPEGRDLARRLLAQCDVLIENFRPGTLEAWGLDPAALRQEFPRLVVARVSGYGQTGPHAPRPGYAAVCEAVGGLRYVTGHPGETPVRSNLSLGDSLAGLHAALGVLLALYARDRGDGGCGVGQEVDVAITESVFQMLEAAIPEYDRLGLVREPAGTTITGIAPTNAYRCRDGRTVVIAANGESNFERLMVTIDRPELARDPRFAGNTNRVQHAAELDAAIGAWAAERDSAEIVKILAESAVPAGPVQNVADLFADPQVAARELLETVEVGGRPLRVPAVVPRLSATPAETHWAGPELGQHNREVYGGLLGLGEEELARLAAAGVI